jgi:LysR family transcriptional regulator, benzoate and cis,cis-muconate-responsive activator of ben and cat genes
MPREPAVSSATLPASVLVMFVLIYLHDDLPLGFESAQYFVPCAAMLSRHNKLGRMELRHLRYFLAVGEALTFTKAAAQLRVAQPALSRQVQDLEDEIGVDLLRRSSRGVTLTAEGKLFLEEVRELLKRADESVERVRALARGEHGELHVGYAPVPTVEILPPALAAFRKAVPRVKVVLHDLSSDEVIAGLHNATLELGVIVQPTGEQTAGIEFELLRTYPLCVALSAVHPFARLKSISLEKVAAQPLVALRRKDYSEYHRILERMFAPISAKPRIAVECDSASSLITEVEAGRGIVLATTALKRVAGKRLLYRPLTGTTEAQSVGIARAANGDVTPAGEKFCEILRKVSHRGTAAKPRPASFF